MITGTERLRVLTQMKPEDDDNGAAKPSNPAVEDGPIILLYPERRT